MIRNRSNWRNYQVRLRKKTAKKYVFGRLCKYVMVVLFFLIIVYGINGGSGGAANSNQTAVISLPEHFPGKAKADPISSDTPFPLFIERSGIQAIDKNGIQELLDDKLFVNIRNKSFDVVSEKDHFHIDTSINIPLQQFILDTIDPSTARYMGIVVMEPYSGRVLAMASFDRDDPHNNPCLDSIFPAASVFKIVTAAAVIERYGFDSDSVMTYCGRKHTLYKSQIKEYTKRKTHEITLRDSFAQSVNPVFGKIGVHYLGKTALEEYAEAFGFNRDIGFDIPFGPSVMIISDEPYHWAEVASGFNRETLISPLHGALIASAVLNRGLLLEPIIVEQITDDSGRMIYQSHLKPLNQAITSDVSEIVNDLMIATIESGTCRKVFRGYGEDDVLSRLSMGGKTGTINNDGGNIRYDWFVGFAEERNGPEKIVVSSVVAHEKYIGKKSSRYARMIFKEYFTNYFGKYSQTENKRAGVSVRKGEGNPY